MPYLKKKYSQPSAAKRSPSGDRRFYKTSRWQKIRTHQLQTYPLCESHRRAGFIVAARVVDHVVAMSLGGDQAHHENLLSLCDECHNRKTGMESQGLIVESMPLSAAAHNDNQSEYQTFIPTFAGREGIINRLTELL